MICYLCGKQASVVCKKCERYVCKDHYKILKSANLYRAYRRYQDYNGKCLCMNCLEPLRCKCGKLGEYQCIKCGKVFCSDHITELEYHYKTSTAEKYGADALRSKPIFESTMNNVCYDCKPIVEIEYKEQKEKIEKERWG